MTGFAAGCSRPAPFPFAFGLVGLLLIELIAVVVVAGPVRAGDLQSWSAFEFKVLKAGPLQWALNGQLRVGDHVSDVYDRRLGTYGSIDVGSRVSVGAGYLLRSRDRPDLGRADWDHRIVAGLKYPVLRRLPSLEGATLYERHIGQPGIEAFNRYRQQFEFERERTQISPLVYQDLTFRREGFVRSRSRVGVRWRLVSGYALRIAYQFESLRVASAWRPRHAIYTEFEFDRAKSAQRPGVRSFDSARRIKR